MPSTNRALKPDPRFEGWSYDARLSAAIAECCDGNKPMATTARKYGIARNSFVVKVKAERIRRVERLDEVDRIMPVTKPGGLRIGEREMPPFVEFVATYFGHWICPDCQVAHPVPDFHKDIIDALEGPNLRQMVLMPPYHGKSTLISQWWLVYQICKNPNIRIILVSKTSNLAKSFLANIWKILTDPDLYIEAERNLIVDYGPFDKKGSGSKQMSTEFTVARVTSQADPTLRALGVGVQIYGYRADLIIFDDIADVESSRNPMRVESLREWIDREALSRIGRTSKAVFVGTRVNAGDIYSILLQRETYRVTKYSCILDDTGEETLWPDHFPYEAAIVKRSETDPSSWQLIYQNHDAFGAGNSFTEEMLESAKDKTRALGQYQESGWRLYGGVDPAGASRTSGVTSITLMAVDVITGERHIVDHYAQKAMPSWRTKEILLDWSKRYPIYEWVIESNALQSQIFQYDLELIKPLAELGTRVRAHQTTGKKWDPQFGVESLGPLMSAQILRIPWGNGSTIKTLQPLIQELAVFPLGATTDRVMSLWFADLGCREGIRKSNTPNYGARATKKWPSRVKNRRRMVDFSQGTVRKPTYEEQSALGRQDTRRKLVNVDQEIDVV